MAFLQSFLTTYAQSKLGVVGLSVFLVFIVLAVVTPYIAPFDPDALLVGKPLSPPSSTYIMGTDSFGRDVLSRILYGTRASLLVGVLAATTSAIIGIIVGAIAGYFGGRIDDLLMRVAEFFIVLPQFFLALIMAAIYGPNLLSIILIISILGWPTTARLLRAQFLYLRELDFVAASKVVGEPKIRIIFAEIFPNALSPIIANSALLVGTAVLLESGLSFMGLSDPNVFSWGKMLGEAQNYIRQAWWLATFPGSCIFILVLAANLIGDGLDQALNPRLRAV